METVTITPSPRASSQTSKPSGSSAKSIRHEMKQERISLITLSCSTIHRAVTATMMGCLQFNTKSSIYESWQLSREIGPCQYTPSVDINYRLHIPTGALAGLTISWFADVSASGFAVSGYAISFLVGYNVEVLFAMMDKSISQLSGEKPAKPTPTTAKPATGK